MTACVVKLNARLPPTIRWSKSCTPTLSSAVRTDSVAAASSGEGEGSPRDGYGSAGCRVRAAAARSPQCCAGRSAPRSACRFAGFAGKDCFFCVQADRKDGFVAAQRKQRDGIPRRGRRRVEPRVPAAVLRPPDQQPPNRSPCMRRNTAVLSPMPSTMVSCATSAETTPSSVPKRKEARAPARWFPARNGVGQKQLEELMVQERFGAADSVLFANPFAMSAVNGIRHMCSPNCSISIVDSQNHVKRYRKVNCLQHSAVFCFELL